MTERTKDPDNLRRLVEVGPLNGFMTNINTAMGLPGHSHTVRVYLTYEHGWAALGPAIFSNTMGALRDLLREALDKPLRNMTNEDVAAHLWSIFEDWSGYLTNPAWKDREHPESQFELWKLTLGVRGVPDKIGHDDSWTNYVVERR